jgi:pentatricopeptide repeat protein
MLAWYSSKKAAGLGPGLQMFESVISCCVNSKHFEIAGRVFEEMMIGSASSSAQKLNLKMASLSLSNVSFISFSFLSLALSSRLSMHFYSLY